MAEKSVITVKISSDLKEKMRLLKINWSEYIIDAIQKKTWGREEEGGFCKA
jgi:post-segregation antitoxin (ccd killing protein)